MRNDVQFISEKEHRFSQKLDYSEILTEQINKVRNSGSTEFRGGYWEERKRVLQGAVVSEKVYIPDTRQIYINSITQLYDLLLPFFDKKFRDDDKNKIQKAIKDHNALREEKKKKRSTGAYNVWYYSGLLKIKRKQYRNLIRLIARL